METEQDKTLEALQIAIQMEIDGKKYYLKASQEVVMSWVRNCYSR